MIIDENQTCFDEKVRIWYEISMHLSRFCTKWWCFRLYNVIQMPFVSSSSDSRWHPCSRHIWRIRPSHGTRTYWWCSQLSCVLPGRWPSAFFLLAMHNQTSFGSALASFVSCRGSSGCGCYGQDTMSHWPKKNPCNWMSYTDSFIVAYCCSSALLHLLEITHHWWSVTHRGFGTNKERHKHP